MKTKTIEELIAALKKIADIDPLIDSEEENEWAEAVCFYKAQDIAREALGIKK